jgi:hypothetical protein
MSVDLHLRHFLELRVRLPRSVHRGCSPIMHVYSARVGLSNVAAAQERPPSDWLRDDLMVGSYACTIEHMVGIQREHENAVAIAFASAYHTDTGSGLA